MFENKQWPEGFEFPACVKCNGGSSDDDLVVAMLARINPFNDVGNRDGRLPGLLRQASRQFPGMLKKMWPTAGEARQWNREIGLKPAAGQTQRNAAHVVRVPEEFHEAVCTLARKLAKGLYYNETGKIFPPGGGLSLYWFTNADFFRDGRYAVFDMLTQLGGKSPPTTRGKTAG
jgi:hypothetical protein